MRPAMCHAERDLDTAVDWRLLLQLDTDSRLEFIWGDMGRLYFWIRESDLRRGYFADTCAILQSY